MAKQSGNIFIEGTLDDLTFYKMGGVYYVRMKSSLTGKKFWKHKTFERSRESCKRFAEGNKLASKVYRMIEEEKKQYKLFCFLKKRAIQLLKEEKSLEEAEKILVDYLVEFGFKENVKNEGLDTKKLFCDTELKRALKYQNIQPSKGEKNNRVHKTPVTTKPLRSKLSWVNLGFEGDP